jgi:hypothetical protein
MKTCYLLLVASLAAFLLYPQAGTVAQEAESRILVVVDMVQLNVAVTDDKGNYVTGLKPEDFAVSEDGIPEHIATFGEGNEPTRSLLEVAGKSPVQSDELHASLQSKRPEDPPDTFASAIAGSNVYILFDTSNYMYRHFVYAQDAIADFIRTLEPASQIAFYSYSRDLLRATRLTPDRSQVLRGVRSTVAGDDAALYNASTVPPEDVAELGQSSGVSIYMISTQQAQLDPVSTAVFERMTAATGGKAYFTKSWKDQERAFASIRDDLAHLYLISYYPQANPNRGWRTISVKLVGKNLKKYHIRTRNGYRPQPVRFSAGNISNSPSN